VKLETPTTLMAAAGGASVERLEAWGGRAVPADNYHEQIALYRAGEVDALWQFMGILSQNIAAAGRPHREALRPRLASFQGPRRCLRRRGSARLDRGHGDVEHAEEVHAIHPAARAFEPARAHLDAGGPLHPGAERYFRDAGFLGSGSA